jgi:hypothetical protein
MMNLDDSIQRCESCGHPQGECDCLCCAHDGGFMDVGLAMAVVSMIWPEDLASHLTHVHQVDLAGDETAERLAFIHSMLLESVN